MTQEEENFIWFKAHQLHYVDFETGRIDCYSRKGKRKLFKDVGSKNEDGYIRIWCKNRLRMKHRLLYWLYYGELPLEIDHINHIRDDNRISNLRSVNRRQNNIGTVRKSRRSFTKEELHSICQDIALNKFSDTALAQKYNCSRVGIMGIRRKRRHKDIADLYF